MYVKNLKAISYKLNSDLWVNASSQYQLMQMLDLCTTFHLVHRTSHKTSLNGSNMMPMDRDTTYGILSQPHLTFKSTDEVMPLNFYDPFWTCIYLCDLSTTSATETVDWRDTQ